MTVIKSNCRVHSQQDCDMICQGNQTAKVFTHIHCHAIQWLHLQIQLPVDHTLWKSTVSSAFCVAGCTGVFVWVNTGGPRVFFASRQQIVTEASRLYTSRSKPKMTKLPYGHRRVMSLSHTLLTLGYGRKSG